VSLLIGGPGLHRPVSRGLLPGPRLGGGIDSAAL